MRPHRVVVTRSFEDAAEMIALLEARGAQAVVFPTIAIAPPIDPRPLATALARLQEYDALILGSKHAALAVFDRIGAQAIAVPVACVGAKTEAYARAHAPGARFITPAVYRAEALAEAIGSAFGGRLRGRRFLFPRAPEGREVLIELLSAEGAAVDAVPAYRIVSAPPAGEAAIAAIESADAFTFLSGETLRAFFDVVPESRARAILAQKLVAVIGPVAKDKAEALGVRVDVVPSTAAVEALVDALLERLGSPRP